MQSDAAGLVAQRSGFLSDLMDTIMTRGRSLLKLRTPIAEGPPLDLVQIASQLLSQKGEASGVALAQSLLTRYLLASEAERRSFAHALLETYGADRKRLDKAIERYRLQGGEVDIAELHDAAEPRRQELFRRINLAEGGTAGLVRMREDLMRFVKDNRDLHVVDGDFVHLFSSWFNRGFLVLRRIDWSTPGNILEKIIRYEAVHAIDGWDDLRNRLQPSDRRCYAFFHPQLGDEPLIFVEVALTSGIPDAIAPLLAADRQPLAASAATTAVFYSISNTQKGLAGVSFGNFLIKQVVEDLKRELPGLKTFVTLSPAPGFAAWCLSELKQKQSPLLSPALRQELSPLLDPSGAAAFSERALARAAAIYFLHAKNSSSKPADPVARFHLGNGARLERINIAADMSRNGMRQSFGVMVNYLYHLDHIEQNHEAFVASHTVAASSRVRELGDIEMSAS
ncbi:MAG: MCD, Malonyl-CoA decarboxylase MCD [Proteobacteria bacterium SG_bin9]|nr:MAG: MCD, Malonyl-CoA decarboxylase MCD [Proteobacteria bacterium SG_bin9]